MRQPLLLFVLLFSIAASGNDGSFYASGGTLFPLKETVVELRKEDLRFKLDSACRHVRVDVFFEFFNPGPERELTIGFVTPPADGDISDRQAQHPQIKDFTVTMNGQPLEWKVWRASESGFRISDSVAQGTDFVYFFKAVFKPGNNSIAHTYSHAVSRGVEMLFHVDYRITTGKMWANGEIGEFNLTIDAGDHAWWAPWSFSKDRAAAGWQLEGKGKLVSEKRFAGWDPETPLQQVRSTAGAVLKLSVKHFRPDYDLFFGARQPYEMTMDHLSSVFGDPKKDYLNAFYSLAGDTAEALALEDWQVQALKNLLYARHGYVFKNEKWKSYFEKQDWYYPVPELKDATTVFDDAEKRLLAMLLYAEKKRK